jgi:signal transduction histidine kinase
VRLANDLQKSRERLVSAREEERRRLRRDLHDGLGPVLASQGLKLAAIKEVLDRDTAIAEQLLDQVMQSNEHTIDDVRRLVYGLRPPALDDLGLVGAIRDQFAADGSAGALGLQVTVDAPVEDLSSIAAAVEVAAYWIVQEAINNVLRHAHAHNCTIRIVMADMLRLDIVDDGVGLPADATPGVGLTSMRERAVELGGTCTVRPRARGGTDVCAVLPLWQNA